jgi:hypothetical protein
LEDFEGAEAVARQALELLSAALPPGHFATAVARCRLGRALAGRGMTAQGRLLLESSVAAIEASARVSRYHDECTAALEAL